MTLRDRIRAALDEDADRDDYALARAVLAGVRRAELEKLVLPVTANEVRRVRREHVRSVEDAAFSPPRVVDGHQVDPLAARKRLLDECMLVPGKGLVRWGEATVEDHQARIAYLSAQAASIGVTITRHEAAIAEIEAAGVSCLYEVAAEGEAA